MFDRMLAELVEVVATLPFSASEAPALQASRGIEPSPRVDYHAFIYRRHVLSDAASRPERLLPALRVILRDPHRRTERMSVRVPLETATRTDASTVAAIPSSALHRVTRDMAGPTGPGARRLIDRLSGHLPVTVLEGRVRSEVDTPETRCVLRFLNEARRVVSKVEALARKREDAFGRRLQGDAERCATLLDRVRRAPLWAEVTDARQAPTALPCCAGAAGIGMSSVTGSG